MEQMPSKTPPRGQIRGRNDAMSPGGTPESNRLRTARSPAETMPTVKEEVSMEGIRAMFMEQKQWMEGKLDNLKTEVKQEIRQEFMEELGKERAGRQALEDKYQQLAEKVDKAMTSRTQIRASSWSPNTEEDVDPSRDVCIGGFKPYSHAGTVKKFAEDNLAGLEEAKVFTKSRRVNRCYARFQSPDARLTFLKSRPTIEKDGRRLWVDRPKSDAELKKGKAVSKLVMVLKRKDDNERFKKSEVDRVYGPGVVLYGDEVIGEWKEEQEMFHIDTDMIDKLDLGVSGADIQRDWNSAMGK